MGLNFTKMLNEILERREVTQIWLARETGISKSVINDLCTGKKKLVNPRHIQKICEHTDCKIDYTITFHPKQTMLLETRSDSWAKSLIRLAKKVLPHDPQAQDFTLENLYKIEVVPYTQVEGAQKVNFIKKVEVKNGPRINPRYYATTFTSIYCDDLAEKRGDKSLRLKKKSGQWVNPTDWP